MCRAAEIEILGAKGSWKRTPFFGADGHPFISIVLGDEEMRLRKQSLGNRNLVGARVEMARKNRE